jgi:hypothetical protein
LAERVSAIVLRGEAAGRTDSPALFAMRLAAALGAAPEDTAQLGIACTLFWAAADVADDIDDGEADVKGLRLFANDACALLLLAQHAFQELDEALAPAVTAYGLRMAAGQALDLTSTGGAAPIDALWVADAKAGAELALFFDAAAKIAGASRGDFVSFGRIFGRTLQIVSDVVDLYVKPEPTDFLTGKWSVPIARYLASPRAERQLWVQDRNLPEVQARMRRALGPTCAEVLRQAVAELHQAWTITKQHCPDDAPFADVVTWLAATANVICEALVEAGAAPQQPD